MSNKAPLVSAESGSAVSCFILFQKSRAENRRLDGVQNSMTETSKLTGSRLVFAFTTIARS